MKRLTLLYWRLPDRVTRYHQLLLHEVEEATVSLGLMTPSEPIIAGGSVIVEEGDIAVWFIFPGAWHDTGLVYSREHRFKGYYLDVLTPAKPMIGGYELTDLFLDLWVFPDGRYLILDRGEFDEAMELGWLPRDLAVRAESELQRLIRDVEERRFPKPILGRLGALPEDVENLVKNLKEA